MSWTDRPHYRMQASAQGDYEEQITDLTRVNDALAAKVAEWKARAEKAEAALKAAEDDRHLTTPCT